MCGRFTQISPPQHYAELFGIDTDLDIAPRYNIAPSLDILACKLAPWRERVLETMHWGLIPFWAKDKKMGYRMINARAETVADKPAFRHAFKSQRCLIPADGFYEWKPADAKQPYYIRRKDGEPMVFAGLWEHWDSPEGEHIDSCTIIVCDANDLLRPIHDRMPVILPSNTWDVWLLSEEESTQSLLEILNPYPYDDLEAYPVSRKVNDARNEGAELIRPIGS